ncbi:Sprouty-related, EVH1 domain-containing protein 2 [Frankliniella fusca]|uniref:Sprouty-related, EVH1 domain-containing protein 2 n=1 Tax=Frankliniella fusca TaxID=407009 RepID=A0AAE1HES4_9NEOP|nr:Sprouty-related, EVH1 domain-containing protein 2 [Frankliniella fusca]
MVRAIFVWWNAFLRPTSNYGFILSKDYCDKLMQSIVMLDLLHNYMEKSSGETAFLPCQYFMMSAEGGRGICRSLLRCSSNLLNPLSSVSSSLSSAEKLICSSTSKSESTLSSVSRRPLITCSRCHRSTSDEEWFERFRPHPGLHRIFNSKLKGVGCTSDALDGELTLYQLDIFRLAAVLETNSSSTANVRTTFSPFSSYCTLMPMKCLWFLEHPSTAIEHIFPFSSSEIFLRIFSANSGIIAGMVFEEMVTLWDKAACIAFIIG